MPQRCSPMYRILGSIFEYMHMRITSMRVMKCRVGVHLVLRTDNIWAFFFFLH